MKTKTLIIAVMVMTMSMGIGLNAFAGEEALAVADHLAMANSYEQKAAEQDALISHHSSMKKDYEKRHYVLKKAGKPGDVKDMEAHCDSIIQAATTLRNELNDFAQWHRMRAAEAQGL